MNSRLQQRLINVNLKTKEDNNIEHKDWLILDDEKERLKNIVNNTFQKYPHNVRLIAKVLFWYINDFDITEILEETKLSKSSIYNYINHYKKDKKFMYNMHKRQKQTISKLEKHQYKIVDDFETSNIRTYKEAQERIALITGINLSISRIFNFLIQHNFEKVDGCYRQIQTEKVIANRIIFEKVVLEVSVDKVKEYISDNHLESDYRLASKVRKAFNIKYTSRSWFSNYLIKNKIVTTKE